MDLKIRNVMQSLRSFRQLFLAFISRLRNWSISRDTEIWTKIQAVARATASTENTSYRLDCHLWQFLWTILITVCCKTVDWIWRYINLLKASGFFTYHQVEHSKILHGTRFALSVLYGYQNRQRLFPYTSLTDWLLYPWWKEFTARYGLIPYTKQIKFRL